MDANAWMLMSADNYANENCYIIRYIYEKFSIFTFILCHTYVQDKLLLISSCLAYIISIFENALCTSSNFSNYFMAVDCLVKNNRLFCSSSYLESLNLYWLKNYILYIFFRRRMTSTTQMLSRAAMCMSPPRGVINNARPQRTSWNRHYLHRRSPGRHSFHTFL